MAKYHLTASGDPKPCNATQGKCPYGQAGEPHFPSNEAARSFYEEEMEGPASPAAGYLLEIAKLQQATPIIQRRDAYYDQVDAFYEKLEEVKAVTTDGRDGSPTVVFPLTPLPEPLRLSQGYIDESVPAESATHLKRLSRTWLKRLSSAETHAVARYAGSDSKKLQDDSTYRGFLEAAVAKAPTFEETTLYSGCSRYVRAALEEAIAASDGKPLKLDLFLSSSLNQGTWSDFSSPLGGPPTALEIVTSTGASMVEGTHAPGELEVLLPPAEYEFLGQRHELLRGKEGVIFTLRLTTPLSALPEAEGK